MLEAMNILLAIIAAIGLSLFIVNATAWNEEEGFGFANRLFGPYGWSFWLMMIDGFLLPQLFWLKQFRKSIAYSILALLGINSEHVILFIASFHQDYLPSSWVIRYNPGNQVIQFLIYTGLVGLTFIIWKRVKNTPRTG